MDDQPEDALDGSELVMPFVACVSNGGPYDDESFTAGWELGAIDMALNVMAPLGATFARWIKPGMVEQLDLIAMKHGRRVAMGDLDDSATWRYVELLFPATTDGGSDA